MQPPLVVVVAAVEVEAKLLSHIVERTDDLGGIGQLVVVRIGRSQIEHQGLQSGGHGPIGQWPQDWSLIGYRNRETLCISGHAVAGGYVEQKTPRKNQARIEGKLVAGDGCRDGQRLGSLEQETGIGVVAGIKSGQHVPVGIDQLAVRHDGIPRATSALQPLLVESPAIGIVAAGEVKPQLSLPGICRINNLDSVAHRVAVGITGREIAELNYPGCAPLLDWAVRPDTGA